MYGFTQLLIILGWNQWEKSLRDITYTNQLNLDLPHILIGCIKDIKHDRKHYAV